MRKQPFSLKILGVTVRVSQAKRDKGLLWAYHFQYPAQRGGKRYRGTIGSLATHTKTMISEILHRKIKEVQTPQPQKSPRLSKLVEVFMNRHGYRLAKQGKREYQVLNQFLEIISDKPLNQIGMGTIDDYISVRLKTVQPSTVKREITVIKSAFYKAIKWGMTTSNPTTDLDSLDDAPPRVRYLVGDEWIKIKDAAKQGPSWLYPACLLARESGLRKGEVRNLLWSDVDLSLNQLRIYNGKAKKPDDRVKFIPINRVVQDMLWKLPREGKFVLLSESKTALDGANIGRAWRKILKETGIEDLKYHDLRHDYASRIVMAGKGIEAAQLLLRHSNLRMTLRYAHLAPGYLRDAVEAIADDATPPSEATVAPWLHSENRKT